MSTYMRRMVWKGRERRQEKGIDTCGRLTLFDIFSMGVIDGPTNESGGGERLLSGLSMVSFLKIPMVCIYIHVDVCSTNMKGYMRREREW